MLVLERDREAWQSGATDQAFFGGPCQAANQSLCLEHVFDFAYHSFQISMSRQQATRRSALHLSIPSWKVYKACSHVFRAHATFLDGLPSKLDTEEAAQ